MSEYEIDVFYVHLDVIKCGKNPESHIGKEIDNIRVYMLMSWTLDWAFGICGLGLLVQIIIFYYFNSFIKTTFLEKLSQ